MTSTRSRTISNMWNKHDRTHRIRVQLIRCFFIRRCKRHRPNHLSTIHSVTRSLPFTRHLILTLFFFFFFPLPGRQSSTSSRKYSQDDNSSKNGNSKQYKKSRKAALQSKVGLVVTVTHGRRSASAGVREADVRLSLFLAIRSG